MQCKWIFVLPRCVVIKNDIVRFRLFDSSLHINVYVLDSYSVTCIT